MPVSGAGSDAGYKRLKQRIVRKLRSMAMLESEMQRLCFLVLARAFLDIGVDCCSSRGGVPGSDSRYFFDEWLHVFFCICIQLDPYSVKRLALEVFDIMEDIKPGAGVSLPEGRLPRMDVQVAFSSGRVMLQVGDKAAIMTANDGTRLGKLLIRCAKKARTIDK